MRYEIAILDSAKKTAAILTGTVYARLREKVNGMSVITVETVERSEWQHITAGTSFLRLRTLPDETYTLFRVKEVKKSRERERPSLIITGRHILADTAEEVFADAVDCVNYSPRQLMDLVLGYSVFIKGSVQLSDTVPYVRFEYETIWECLLRICSLTGGELELDVANGEINLLASIGSANNVVFSYGLNLKGAVRTINTSRLANRVYGVGGGNPPLNLISATLSGGSKYAEDTSSIEQFGLSEAVYHEPTLEEVVNLVATPALDGDYSGGLCENWTNSGATVSKNTDPDYYLYGRASQRVQTAGAGQGVQQVVSVTAGVIYSLLANIFITSGSVRILVQDGTSSYKRPEPVTGSGLATIRIENWKANNTSVTVKIAQEGEGSADFHVDSVQIAQGVRAKPFTAGKSADMLWNRTVEYLNAHKEPRLTYDIDLVDLYGDIRAGHESDRFGLGDTVTVSDPTLNLEVVTRVMERDVDILHPWRVRVRLDNPAQNLIDVLVSIRKAQEEGVKHTRTAMAESSSAAEAGSTRIGFSRQAYRFSGIITVNTWNSLSWSAGTLRVGNGYYEIMTGSASGLAASFVYYFYFNRTSPTIFSYTTSMTQAEGEDRILVFAVTTTTSPDLCKVYPLGVIHV